MSKRRSRSPHVTPGPEATQGDAQITDDATRPATRAGSSMLEEFRAARRVSTPLIAIRTPDPAATIHTICEAINGSALKFCWDVSRGLLGLSPEAGAAITDLIGADVDRQGATQDPHDTLALARRLPPKSILFFCNAHRFLDGSRTGSELSIQAIW
ncbi:MAG: hypothetical protein PHR35_23170, partial [Kiritimatiellae bacterium]|nr:hypothetical protein [Kiritimatiellia bacterium]